jgi:spore coat protein U-like protein
MNHFSPRLLRPLITLLIAALSVFLAVPVGGDASGFFAAPGACMVAAMPIAFGTYDPLRQAFTVTSPPANAEVNVLVYGRLFGDQKAPAGSYNVSVIATY